MRIRGMSTTDGQQFRKSGMGAASARGGHDGSGFLPGGGGSEESPDAGQQRIALVADDEPLVRHLVCSVLARKGWRTIEASDGVEALGLSIDEKVDLLITDYEMPTISGLQLANEVRRRTPDVPILMISGYAACINVARTHGYLFLQKPLQLDDLVSQVESVAGQQAGDPRFRSAPQPGAHRTGTTAR
jgi:DNA-binding NtrC family response regulator